MQVIDTPAFLITFLIAMTLIIAFYLYGLSVRRHTPDGIRPWREVVRGHRRCLFGLSALWALVCMCAFRPAQPGPTFVAGLFVLYVGVLAVAVEGDIRTGRKGWPAWGWRRRALMVAWWSFFYWWMLKPLF